MNTKKIRSFSQGTSGKDFIRLNKVTVSQMSKKAKKPIVSSHKYFQTTIRATSPKMITKNSDLDEHASQQEDLISPIMSPVTEQESQNEELNEGVRQKFEINRLNMEAPIDEILASLQTYKSVELPPTPPNHPPSSIVYKPENEINYSGSSNRETPLKSDDPLFRNVDYSGMPLSEQIKRSARRVIINENGDEVSDRT